MERLITLLCDHWTPDEFHRVLVVNNGFGAGEALIDDLTAPKDARPLQFFVAAALLLQRHDAIGRRFFAALRRSRPRVEADLNRLEASLRARPASSPRRTNPKLVAAVGVTLAALVSLAQYSCAPDHSPSKSRLTELMQ